MFHVKHLKSLPTSPAYRQAGFTLRVRDPAYRQAGALGRRPKRGVLVPF
ncbi:MAG: hypothetical protein QME90_15140 [Thermodesulfobacteriota bacterium]|nr:hypothetical protein [Thermodesulfobacteriota bacterium]